jgi:hypothetical protein
MTFYSELGGENERRAGRIEKTQRTTDIPIARCVSRFAPVYRVSVRFPAPISMIKVSVGPLPLCL